VSVERRSHQEIAQGAEEGERRGDDRLGIARGIGETLEYLFGDERLGGDIEVGKPGTQRGFNQGRGGVAEWARCIDDRVGPDQEGIESARIQRVNFAEFSTQARGDGSELRPVASAEDRGEAASSQLGSDKLAGVASGAVQRDSLFGHLLSLLMLQTCLFFANATGL